MDHRPELLRLITAGAQRAEVYDYFSRHDFHPLETDAFLHEAGVYLPEKPKHRDDSISDERRLFLQELSTRID
jgi:hypothetical protein